MSYRLHEYAVEARAQRMHTCVFLILKNEFLKSGCMFFCDCLFHFFEILYRRF